MCLFPQQINQPAKIKKGYLRANRESGRAFLSPVSFATEKRKQRAFLKHSYSNVTLRLIITTLLKRIRERRVFIVTAVRCRHIDMYFFLMTPNYYFGS